MHSNIRKFIFLLLFFVLLQGLFFNYISFPFGLHVFVIPYFCLLLPLNTRFHNVLLLCFISGIFVDLFSSNIGISAAAATGAALVRIICLKIWNRIDNKNFEEQDDIPNPVLLGKFRYLRYVATVIGVYYTEYFLLDAFSLFDIYTWVSIFLGSSLSVLFFFIFILFTRNKLLEK